MACTRLLCVRSSASVRDTRDWLKHLTHVLWGELFYSLVNQLCLSVLFTPSGNGGQCSCFMSGTLSGNGGQCSCFMSGTLSGNGGQCSCFMSGTLSGNGGQCSCFMSGTM